MGRFLTSIVLAIGGIILSGCASQATASPVKPPPRAVQPHTEVSPGSETKPPELIAPPPAYGNKIVMAKGPQGRATF